MYSIVLYQDSIIELPTAGGMQSAAPITRSITQLVWNGSPLPFALDWVNFSFCVFFLLGHLQLSVWTRPSLIPGFDWVILSFCLCLCHLYLGMLVFFFRFRFHWVTFISVLALTGSSLAVGFDQALF